ncbi:hypothetical protein ACRQ5Q_14605 [Bradyrhizobium sp. PMVTL-01]|uniref:hypothetical protein n=1 Tax=Bradyrhizobium sp. PMVTL-01 TaxID=3434999 RepID=UPI003F71C931
MKAEAISDQKRLVRAEQWIFARQVLRGRDFVHHKKWRIMIVAGPSPAEEINCIRELMPQAHITAVDFSDSNLSAAKLAGADQTINHDLFEFGQIDKSLGKFDVPSEKLGDVPFDVVCLDLTGPANEEFSKAIKVYLSSLTKGGVIIATFSYGRDVKEAFIERWKASQRTNIRLNRSFFSGQEPHRVGIEETIKAIGIPDGLKERIYFLLGRKVSHLRSVIQYRGNAMPMVSMMIQKRHGPCPGDQLAKFKAIADGDFEAAVTAENIGNIYACPAERIEALRRSLIARKAVATRREKDAARSRKYRAAHGAGMKRGRPSLGLTSEEMQERKRSQSAERQRRRREREASSPSLECGE